MDLHIRATVLPAGTEQDVFVVGGRLAPEPPGPVKTVLDDGFLIPGLVDAHAHLPFAGPAADDEPWERKALVNARAQLEAGVLAVRDPGGPTPAGIGPEVGLPRTVTAGRFLAVPDGMFPGHGQVEVPEEAVPEAAEEQLRASGSWVKLIGDFPERGRGITTRFSPETLAEVARRVHALGGRVTVHAILAETIDAVIDAGFDAIEHGMMLRPDQAEAMARRGMALVPTLIGLENWPQILTMFAAPAEEVERSADAVRRQPEAVRAAWEAGVEVLAGTDAGMVAHGLVREEVRALIAAGLPPEYALGAASWRGRAFLGLPGIEDGAPADLVAFPANPLEDPSVLASPSLIVLDGQLVKGGADAGTS